MDGIYLLLILLLIITTTSLGYRKGQESVNSEGTPTVEGFTHDSLTSKSASQYDNCRQQGYTKEFCLQNPLYVDTCQCPSGNLGRILPGYKGACVCGVNESDVDFIYPLSSRDQDVKVANNAEDMIPPPTFLQQSSRKLPFAPQSYSPFMLSSFF